MSGFDRAGGRRPDGAALVIAALLTGLGGLLIWQGMNIPDKGGYAGIGSGDIPIYIGLCLLALALAHVHKGLVQGTIGVAPQRVVPVLLIVGGLLAQLILLHPLGFSIATGILFAATAAAFGRRNPVISLPVGILFALMVYGVFDRLLQLNLPGGFLENLIFGG